MLILFIRNVLLLIFIQTVDGTTKQCGKEWFGPWCDLKCYCRTECLSDGSCPNYGQCIKPRFGPSCQYYDRLSEDPNVPLYFKDDDPTTCNPDMISHTVHISFYMTLTFTWFRITVDDPRTRVNFTTSFNMGKQICWNEKKFVVDDITVDVTCDIDVAVDSLQITGIVALTICDIYISGGRNLALRQKTWQSSNAEPNIEKCKSQNAVDSYDGNHDYESGVCSKTNVEESGPEFKLKFRHAARVLRLVFEGANGYDYHDMGVWLYDAKGSTVAFYTTQYSNTAFVIMVDSNTSVVSLTIKTSTQRNIHTRILAICELIVYGEHVCPDRMYGLFCDHKCNCSETDACNYVTGSCAPGCPIGTYGFNCSLNCSPHCLPKHCNFFTGSCTPCHYGYFGNDCSEECRPGTYGLVAPCKNCSVGCRNTCNKITGACFCKQNYIGRRCDECVLGTFGPGKLCPKCFKGCANICNATNGRCVCRNGYTLSTCSECRKGRFGSDCQYICGKGCANRCSEKDGHCVCRKNYAGLFCADCKVGNYGPDCQFTCSVGCRETCNRTYGRCNCKPGFGGVRCSECLPGLFGAKCMSRCGKGCDEQCSKNNGRCRCKKNYVGRLCTECRPKSYGSNCEKNCSRGCDGKCDLSNGTCVCLKHFKGVYCSECVHPRYGRRCDLHCSKHCYNQECEAMTGKCISCAGGLDGGECADDTGTTHGWAYPIPFMIFLVGIFIWMADFKHNEEENFAEMNIE